MKYYFEIVLDNLFPDVELPFTVYSVINQNYIAVLPEGIKTTAEKIRKIAESNKKIYVNLEDTDKFQKFFTDGINNPNVSSEQKAKGIKNVAFSAVEGLFTNQDINNAMKDSVVMVQSMVGFVTTHSDALENLLMLSGHSYYTYNHSVNVAVYTIALAQRIFQPSQKELEEIALGAFLHDIGKRYVPISIINKSGKLDDQEWETIKKHPEWGLDMVKDQPSATSIVKAIIHQHHENFNGSGYPQGLEKDQIHPYARVAAVADSFDAMTSKRAYSEPLSVETAIQILQRSRAIRYDPKILGGFMTSFNRRAA